MTATFTLTGDLEPLVGSRATRSIYVELTTDVTDTTDNKTFDRASRSSVSGVFELENLPAWDPLNLPYDGDAPQFGLKVTIGRRVWQFPPPAAGETIDLSDVTDVWAAPLVPSQFIQVEAWRNEVAADRAQVEEDAAAVADTVADLIALDGGAQGLALDTDGVPYFDEDLLGTAPTLALLVDTDGAPYLVGA